MPIQAQKKEQLAEDIKQVTQMLEMLHSKTKKNKGVYTMIDYYENLLTDMINKEREGM